MASKRMDCAAAFHQTSNEFKKFRRIFMRISFSHDEIVMTKKIHTSGKLNRNKHELRLWGCVRRQLTGALLRPNGLKVQQLCGKKK